VQHQEGGLVRQVKVRDGQSVQAGELLIELEDVGVRASLQLLNQQHAAEQARHARLEAEKGLAASIRFEPGLLARTGEPGIGEVLSRERVLFKARRHTLDSQIHVLEQQLLEVHSEAAALERQLGEERNAIALQKEELGVNAQLAEQHYVERTRVLGLQRAVADYAIRVAAHEADLARARQKINDLRLRALSLRNDYSETAARELRDSTTHLLDLEQRLRPGADATERQQIRAPVAGVVMGLRPLAPGNAVAPRETLLEIVPAQAPLVIEARVRPEDIRQVRPGQPADVHLTAWHQRITPVVEGRVRQVSADTFTDAQTQQRYYRIEVEIAPEALRQAGALTLQAGMPADLYLRTRSRSIARYLVEPFTEVLERSMRED
jgi:HlyD family type I secretion membrane fusion protein